MTIADSAACGAAQMSLKVCIGRITPPKLTSLLERKTTLFGSKSSLFRSVGKLRARPCICSEIPTENGVRRPRTTELSRSFPCLQGSLRRRDSSRLAPPPPIPFRLRMVDMGPAVGVISGGCAVRRAVRCLQAASGKSGICGHGDWGPALSSQGNPAEESGILPPKARVAAFAA